jgi:hypothetical protein
MARDPVAWRVIEQGWSVLDADGHEVGKVDRVTGDVDADIFDGITVGDGGTVLTRARYVPSEQIAHIYQGEIVLAIGTEAAANLEPYHAPVAQPLAELAPEPDPPAANMNRGLGGLLTQLLFGRRL